jgi:MFS family permease
VNDTLQSPFQIPNVRWFILFRVLFNAPFYYPVFSILFLDFGLTLSQFAILNAVWAATIVLCEVPSGALADTIGRRNLLVVAGALMVIEIALWAFVPRSNLTLLFWVLVLNRVLSGMAEAAASGADEALAYDSLKQQGDETQWSRVLERQIQVQSIGFVVAMTLGGIVYDPALMQSLTESLGLDWVVDREATLRLPIYLTLFTAVLTFLTTLCMKETIEYQTSSTTDPGNTLKAAFRLIWQAAVWMAQTPFILGLILFGLLYDSVIRMLLTMASQYYRIIEIPEALFGVLGSILALFGFVMPMVARQLAERYSPLINLLTNAAFIFLGLIGMTFIWPLWGILPALILFGSMYLINFYLSHYINQVARSDQRATVLSFKGLFLNLGYGLIGIFYSILLAYLRGKTSHGQPDLTEESLKNLVFVESLPWFCGYFILILLILLVIFSRRLYHRPG